MEHKKPTESETNSDDELGPFHINKNGFPIDEKTWNRIWKIAFKIYPDAQKDMQEIKQSDDLADLPVSGIPIFTPQMTTPQCIQAVQDFINSLNYNHTGTQLFEIRKSRPLAGLMDKAKEMIKESLPIKCLEAVILAIYLTNSLHNVERFPIGFKSVFNGHRYYHVVLGIYFNGAFGALGISRRKDLMDKDLKFKTLFEMITDYQTAYASYTHELKKVRLGGLVSHDPHSHERIHWGMVSINFAKTTAPEQQYLMDHFSRGLRSHFTTSVSVFLKKDLHPASRQFHREYTLPVKANHKIQNGEMFKSTKRKSHSSPVTSDTYHVKV